MANPHPDGGFDLNKDAVGLDLNVPVLEEDGREVQRLPAVEVYLHNPIDWDELQEDLFDLSNPIYFHAPEEGSNTLKSFSVCIFLLSLICLSN